MDNQHRKIDGYRDLEAADISLINRIKAQGEELGALVAELRTLERASEAPSWEADEALRWIALGQTHLQQGLMALTRAVAKPTNF